MKVVGHLIWKKNRFENRFMHFWRITKVYNFTSFVSTLVRQNGVEKWCNSRYSDGVSCNFIFFSWNQFHEKFRENDGFTKKNSNTTGDVLLLGVNGTSFRAHRLVLAAASEFLKTVLLQYPIGEEPVVFLDQMSAETMVDLMDYLYRGQVSLSPRRLDNLIGE